MNMVETLGKAGIIPVIVIEKEEQAVPLARALVKGGLPVLEVTFRTKAAPGAIAAIRREVLLMLCSILGWIADSLLFTNLRERCGLCYYCLLSLSAFKHTLFIDIGIDADDLDAVQAAVSAQIKALQSGDFTDDMMQKAVLRYAFQAAAASDTISDLAMQSILMLRRGDPRSPQEISAAMQKVTRAEIAAAAKQLVPDVVYVLRAEQEEAEADDI